ncbi:MAG: carbohydrate binding domain-containing protein [Armatimonadota bacterium]|nr:carbohydrate binding domain-containing protein [Armatimonadota bacterium]
MRLAVAGVCCAAAVLCVAVAGAADDENLLRNGSFEDVSEDHPNHWSLTTHGNEANLFAVTLPDGTHALRLSCSRFEGGWVIAAQDGVVEIERGQWYRLTFRARAEDLRAAASVAIYQRDPWVNAGLVRRFIPGKVWQEYEMHFQGEIDAFDTRFEFFFSATGALYLDDVRLTESESPATQAALPAAPGKNSVRNASFELADAWWGSLGADTLQGEVVAGGVDGQHCLRVAADPESAPVYYSDWYEVRTRRVLAGSAVSEGWYPVEEGQRYCVSAYVRSETLPLRATLRVICHPRGGFSQTFDVTDRWQRIEASGELAGTLCFVVLQIEDLPGAGEPIPEGAGPWELLLDAVQLERGATATEFEPRHPVEIALTTDRPGNVFFLPERLRVRLHACNWTEEPVERAAAVAADDAWDRTAATAEVALSLSPGEAVTRTVALDVPRGFFRARASLGEAEADLRTALVAKLRNGIAQRPGRFGINHPAPSDLRMDLWQQGGMSWVRDWSCKWHQVQESEGAPFEFDEQDRQINRVLERGMHVLLCLPECSVPWNSTAPPEALEATGRQLYGPLKHPPADLAGYEDYVAATVQHTAGRVQWFEIINEPSAEVLPPEKYLPIMRAAHRAARSVSNRARIVGGKSAGPGPAFKWYEQFLQGGGTEWMDAVNVHIYPGNAQPAALEAGLEMLNEAMERSGDRRPIWCTEWLYGADDDPAPTIPEWPPTGRVRTELRAAAFAIQFYVVGMANGVEMFFQHTSHWATRINRPHLLFDSFFEYRAAPRKAFAAHNAMVSLLGSHPEFSRKLRLGEGGYGAAFEANSGDSVAVLWRLVGSETARLDITALPDGCRVLDMMGVPIDGESHELGWVPVYVTSHSLPPHRLAAAVERAL